MFQVIFSAVEVQVTQRPWSQAGAEMEVQVWALTLFHSQTGIPITALEPGGGAMPISGPVSCMACTARRASSSGVMTSHGGVARHSRHSSLAPPMSRQL